jgi:hypothetical protein
MLSNTKNRRSAAIISNISDTVKMRRKMEMSDVEIEIIYTLDLARINLFSQGGTLILNF